MTAEVLGQPAGNLFDGIPQQLTGELVELLASDTHVRIERIVSRGHRSPDGFWYDQEQAEWVILLAGSATIVFRDGGRVVLAPGDYINIPAHLKHRVEDTHATEDTVWLAVFYDKAASSERGRGVGSPGLRSRARPRNSS